MDRWSLAAHFAEENLSALREPVQVIKEVWEKCYRATDLIGLGEEIHGDRGKVTTVDPKGVPCPGGNAFLTWQMEEALQEVSMNLLLPRAHANQVFVPGHLGGLLLPSLCPFYPAGGS